MERRNITVSLPRELLRKVKIIAVNRDVSISGLLEDLLTDLALREDAYAQAMERHMAVLQDGYDLGTYGRIPYTREALHDRER